MRNILRSVSGFARSIMGTNGVARQIATIDGKLDAIAQRLVAPGETTPHAEASEPPTPTRAAIDVNLLQHQARSALMREMPPGAKRLLSAGCAGAWYFDWIEQTYGRVQEHLGIEYYAPKPDDLPDNVTWIANTAGNMEAVESGSCDIVISGQNIEHLWPDEVADFLMESARVLRPGGTLCVDSPNRAITALLNWSHPEHTIELTVPEMRRLLHLAGFDVTKEAGLWLCQDPRTGRMLPFDPNVDDADWSVTERLIAALDKPEQSMLWWVEGSRSERAPDRSAIAAVLAEIFSHAWPERTQRQLLGPGRKTEQRSDGEWVVAAQGEGGVVFYGPYMPLRAGRYRVSFDAAPDPCASGPYAKFDVVYGTDAVVLREIVATPGSRELTLELDLPKLAFGCQFRCISLGQSGFAVRRHVELTEVRYDDAALFGENSNNAAAPSGVMPSSEDRPEPGSGKVFATATLADGTAFQLSVDKNSADPWHAAVAANAWQGPTWKFVMAWLRPGEEFFDLGANIGTVSIPAALAGARVTAFEMLSSNVVDLGRAVVQNRLHNLTIVVGPLSDRPGLVGIGGASAWGKVADKASVYASALVLDDYVSARNIARVDFMKIDIEGSEQKALAGAARLLDRDHPDIVIEINSETCATLGSSCSDLMRQLVDHQYRLYRIFPDSLAPWIPDMVQEVVAPDYLATTKNEAAIEARCGWPVRQRTDEDLVNSMLASAVYEGTPRLHMLAVADRLPANVRNDPRISALLEAWKPLSADPVFEAIRLSSA